MPNEPLFPFKPATMMQQGTKMRIMLEEDFRKKTTKVRGGESKQGHSNG
jgi:hypothetical protein